MDKCVDNIGYISTMCLGSGWAAVHLKTYVTDNGCQYQDIWTTGLGRYASSKEAEAEGIDWAAAEGIEFK